NFGRLGFLSELRNKALGRVRQTLFATNQNQCAQKCQASINLLLAQSNNRNKLLTSYNLVS
ncbi:hypothetical protein CGJ93_21720, partial [Vibrio parahaemolyticus]